MDTRVQHWELSIQFNRHIFRQLCKTWFGGGWPNSGWSSVLLFQWEDRTKINILASHKTICWCAFECCSFNLDGLPSVHDLHHLDGRPETGFCLRHLLPLLNCKVHLFSTWHGYTNNSMWSRSIDEAKVEEDCDHHQKKRRWVTLTKETPIGLWLVIMIIGNNKSVSLISFV